MQKRHFPLGGLRLLAWGAILLMLMALGMLLMDDKEPVMEPRGAVLVSAGAAA